MKIAEPHIQGIAADGRFQSAVLALIALAFLHAAPLTGAILLGIDIAGTAHPWIGLIPIVSAHNPLLADTLAQYYPWRSFFDHSLREGVWPLWNPYILAGHPTFASINEQIFYPPNALFSLLPAELSFSWLAWFHLSVAGIGTRAFARLHLADDASACLAAVAVMLAGPTIVWLEYPAFLSTLCWAGVGLYCVERAFRRLRLSDAIGAGATFGVALLGGQIQLFLFLAILSVGYVVVRLVTTLLRNQRAGVRAGVLMVIAALVAGAIGSLAVVPALEFVGLAHREIQDIPQFFASTLPTDNLKTFVLPNRFGNPVDRNFIGAGNFNEATVYLGILPILLAGLFLWTKPKSAAIACLAVCGVIFVAGMFGVRPIDAALARIPFMRYFGLNRLATVLPFCFGLMGAATYSALPATGRRRVGSTTVVLIVAAVVGAVAILGSADPGSRLSVSAFVRSDAIIALACLIATAAVLLLRIWSRPDSAVRWLGPLVLAVDLFSFGFNYNTLVKPNPLAGPATAPLNAIANGPFAARTVGLPTDMSVLTPNLGMLWDIPTPDGYVSEYLADYGQFVQHANPVITEGQTLSQHLKNGNILDFAQARPPYIALLGIRYIVTTRDPEVADTLPGAGDAVTSPLFGSVTIGTYFRARQDGLHRIDVFPSTNGHPGGHWIALHLKSSPQSPDHLAYVRLNSDAIVAGKPLTFYFKPIGDSAGQRYYFYLDAPEATSGDALSLRFHSETTVSAESMLVDDRPVPGILSWATYATPAINWRLLATANDTTVYENPGALPRAFLVDNVRPMTDGAFYQGMDDGTFDPGTAVAVAGPPPAGWGGDEVASDQGREAPVDVESAGPHTVVLRATANHPALLVVSNAWYPGWLAHVDGVAQPVSRVDAVFQGVYLSAGVHHVRLSFEPTSLRIGALLGAGSLVFIAVALTVSWLRRPSRAA